MAVNIVNPRDNDEPTMWPSALVASLILLLIGAITVMAIWKYDTVEDALKMWSALSALIGVVTGAFVAYFFTKEQVAEAKQQTNQANARADEQVAKASQAEMAASVLWGATENAKRQQLLQDPKVLGLFGPAN
jgi:hypothetical protein